jgi:dTDP-N-acetylfucosamine:lipid II N-acetylfucosaminyltransferase
MYKILHIGSSNVYDSPFMKSSISIFERAYSGQNQYLLISDSNKAYDYTSFKDLSFLFLNTIDSKKFLNRNEEIFKIIIFHGLNSLNIDLAYGIKNYDKCIWLFWGGEIYNNPLINKKEIYGFLTKKAIKNSSKNFKEIVVRTARIFFFYPMIYHKLKRVIPNFKHLGVPFQEDYCEISSMVKFKGDLSFFQYSYYPLEFVFSDFNNCESNGINILVGNSSTPENNHLEIFEILYQADLKNRNIITILSYGDVKYKNFILKEGEKILQKNFRPITEFIPLTEYNTLLKSCNIAILNHYRQQGMGNVISLLWMGTKLFLSEKNTIYLFLKRKNIIIYSVEELKEDFSLLDLPLNDLEIVHNRNILFSEFSYNTILNNLKIYINLNFDFKNN